MERYSENNLNDTVQTSETANDAENKLDFTIDDIFVNLTLLSKIEIGYKLVQNGKYINIDNSYFQSVTRWFYGANRNSTLHFINLVLHKAYEIMFELYTQLNVQESVQLLLRLNNELKNSINGLTNLKQTYYYDKLVQSEIDVMIDNIRSKLDYYITYQKYVNKNIPVHIKNIEGEQKMNNENREKQKKYGCSEYKEQNNS
jgi:hypothetical protein